MAIDSFKDLNVWKLSMDLVEVVYKITAQLPPDEKYGISSQLQRSAVSVPSNIAEGSKRTSRTDFRHFCLMSLGSAAELETQLLLIERLHPKIDLYNSLDMVVDIQKMLTSLAKKLKQNNDSR